jgi:hypothetical protein
MEDSNTAGVLEEFRALRPAPDVLSRQVEEESVLVDLATNRIFSLNTTGARFWQLLQEGLNPVDAFLRLRMEFEVAEPTLIDEVRSFCELLERERLVTRAAG